MSSSRPRTLIIGIDGATWDTLHPWIAAGYLPAFARLLERGAQGSLLAWPNTNSAAAWTSLVTGCNPGKHAVYDFGAKTPQRDGRLEIVTAASRQRPAFWQILDAHEQRAVIINVPITYPADQLKHGRMLSGMDAPGVNSRGFAHPPGLLDELRSAGIRYVLDVDRLPDLARPCYP